MYLDHLKTKLVANEGCNYSELLNTLIVCSEDYYGALCECQLNTLESMASEGVSEIFSKVWSALKVFFAKIRDIVLTILKKIKEFALAVYNKIKKLILGRKNKKTKASEAAGDENKFYFVEGISKIFRTKFPEQAFVASNIFEHLKKYITSDDRNYIGKDNDEDLIADYHSFIIENDNEMMKLLASYAQAIRHNAENLDVSSTEIEGEYWYNTEAEEIIKSTEEFKRLLERAESINNRILSNVKNDIEVQIPRLARDQNEEDNVENMVKLYRYALVKYRERLLRNANFMSKVLNLSNTLAFASLKKFPSYSEADDYKEEIIGGIEEAFQTSKKQ